jgi:predicted nucleotidyltransferase
MERAIKLALQAAVVFLEANHYRYAVIGGLALARWNVARYTHDVDIKVIVPNTDYPAVRTAIRRNFPELARPHAPENPLIVAVSIQDVTVDFLLALPGYEELIIERAVCCDLGGFSAQICSAEDLIIQKAVAGRGKDWLDVEALLIEQRNRLDYAYIEDWLTQFVEALEAPELLNAYHELKSKVEGYAQ